VLRDKKVLYVSDSLAANVHARGIFAFSNGLLEMLRSEGARLYLLSSDVAGFGVKPRVARALRLSQEIALTPAAASFFENYEGSGNEPTPGLRVRVRKSIRLAAMLLGRLASPPRVRVRQIDSSLLDFTTDRSRFVKYLSGLAVYNHVYEVAKFTSIFGIPGPRIDAREFEFVVIDTPTNVRIEGPPVIQVVHDLIPLTDPTLTARSRTMFATALAQAVLHYNRFAFVSEYSRAQFLRLFPRAKDTMQAAVIYPRIRVPDVLEPVSNGPKYAAIIISDEPRKNFEKAIEAAADFDPDLSLWVMGRAGSRRFKNVLAMASQQRNNVRALGYVSDTHKAQVIRDAVCVIVPAFSEGFGLPIAESFAQGTPVACSDTVLFREVAGDLASYFDPYSPTSIAKAVNKLARDRSHDREVLRQRALQYDVRQRPESFLRLFD
jgi:glycosyltransferase involved in cell wall biosynthesis